MVLFFSNMMTGIRRGRNLRNWSAVFLTFFVSCLLPVCRCGGSVIQDGTPTGEVRGYYRREHSLVKPYQGEKWPIKAYDVSWPYGHFLGQAQADA